MKLETIAYHEAGHAVVAAHLGVRFWKVTIIPNRPGNEDYDQRFGLNEGSLKMVCPGATRHQHADWAAHVRADLAGYAAQKKWRPGSVRAVHWSHDRACAGLIIVCYLKGIDINVPLDRNITVEDVERIVADIEPIFADKLRDTERLVADLWPAIERVARALLDKRTLTEGEVLSIMHLRAAREMVVVN